ncbi:transporter substrate-binding domain-containing protein [Dichotomicrobium thermohalophilum]|uniref:transporter substrate-binding domain-containing protein n=1 Tax=Dichotomicrobium thermohalophilum TaxID=933063 RepID=UPI001472A0D8|nr:transporter substrate-binding domain-containing protein [Dichotomicrobium thermohalophilum]
MSQWAACLLAALFMALAMFVGPAGAQDEILRGPDTEAEIDSTVGPRPDWSWLEQLRFVTTSDFPPFNYYDEDGVLTGLNVDLARSICRVLSVNCQVSELEWDDLTETVNEGAADAALAGIAITPETVQQLDFTDIYLQIPARFAAQKTAEIETITAESLDGQSIGVARDTAHHAFLKTFFPDAELSLFDNLGDARAALRAGGVDLVFADGLSTVFWVNGAGSRGCCKMVDGGFMEPRYFGQGLAIAVKRGNDRLVTVLNYALARLRAEGRLEELMLRYFPLSLY